MGRKIIVWFMLMRDNVDSRDNGACINSYSISDIKSAF